MKKAISWLAENIGAVFFIVGFGFMQLSAFQVFHNIYQANVKAASGLAHVAGFILSTLAVVWMIAFIKDDSPEKSPTANAIGIMIMAVLGLCAYAGFSFNIG